MQNNYNRFKEDRLKQLEVSMKNYGNVIMNIYQYFFIFLFFQIKYY